MKNLPSHGDCPAELMEEVKALMIGELDFAEQEEPLRRNLDGRVSAGGYIESNFNFDFREIAPFSEDEIKAELKKLKAEKDMLAKAYPSQIEKQAKIRSQMEDYSRQLRANEQAAQAAQEQAGYGDKPVMTARTEALEEATKDEPKHGKIGPGADDEVSSKQFVDLYKKYQDRAYATQVDASGALMPAAKQKAMPMSGETGPGGMDTLPKELVAGSKAYWQAAQSRREARKKK